MTVRELRLGRRPGWATALAAATAAIGVILAARGLRGSPPLLIIGGVSVTNTLPHGKPEDVRRELQWLVRNGPKTGLFLGGSSSITPGVPWENLKTLTEGFRYYREHGRD